MQKKILANTAPLANFLDGNLNLSTPVETPQIADDKTKKGIDLNNLFPKEEKDLNNLFPEPEMRILLKKIDKNRKDIATMNERFEHELQIDEQSVDPS
tara:strand:- start:4 stop:297 length:294 start_codon:yes stop_codon:yes gene_type:complete